MPVGSLQAFNMLGQGEAQKKEAEKREAEKRAPEDKSRSGFSQMSDLWDQATRKKEPEKKVDRSGGLVPQVSNLWDSATGKKKDKGKNKDTFRFFGDNSKKKPSIDWGPGGAIGIGCGVGVGVGLTGETIISPQSEFC